MIKVLKRRLKTVLTKLACDRLGLFRDPPYSFGALVHPFGQLRRLGVRCSGVIHVGANLGQEFDSYLSEGIERAVYIEPIPEVFEKLKARVSGHPSHRAVMALCSDREGDEVMFNVADNEGQSSSMLELGQHAIEHPDVKFVSRIPMRTTTVDQVVEALGADFGPLDCLVMDVQGAEAKVIAGATRTLARCKAVFTEVSEGDLYRGDADMDRVIGDLKRLGFKLKVLEINEHRWGNALLVR